MPWNEIHTLEEHSGNVLAMAVEGRYLFTAGTDCKITVWDLSRLEVVKVFTCSRRPIIALEVGVVTVQSAGGAREVAVLLSSSENMIRVYEQGSWQLLTAIAGHAGDIFCMSLDGNLLCFGCQDTNVKTLDLGVVLAKAETVSHADGESDAAKSECSDGSHLHLQELPFSIAREHLGFVYSVYVQERTLFSASGDSTILVRDVRHEGGAGGAGHLAVTSTLQGHEGSVYAVRADGTCIYSAGQDGKVKVWDQETGYLRRTLTGHSGEVLAMAQSGAHLFTGDSSGILKIWDKKSLRCSYTQKLDSTIMLIRYKNGIVFVATDVLVRVWCSDDAGKLAKAASSSRRGSMEAAAKQELAASTYGDDLLLAMRDPLLQSLKEFVLIRSISAQEECRDDCWKAAKFFWKKLEHYGFQAQLVEGELHKNPLVFGRLGHDKRKPTVTMYGHYDVFDVQPSQWSQDPFHLLAKNGFLYGRGVSDDKGPILAMLYACVDLLQSGGDLPVNVAFVVEGEEECNSAGLRRAVEQNLAWFAGTDVVLLSNSTWLGSTRPCLTYGLRGMVSVSVEVRGPAKNLHSGVDGGAISEPMMELVQLLAGIVGPDGGVRVPGFYADVLPASAEEDALYDGLEFDLDAYRRVLGVGKLVSDDAKELLKKRWRLPTLSVHSLGTSGHSASSTVIPGTVTAQISMRLVPNQSAEVVFAKFKAYIEEKFAAMGTANHLEVRLNGKGDWWLADPTNRFFKAAEQSLTEVWGTKPFYTREGGTIPLTAFLERTLKAPALHLPLGQTLDGAHLSDEHIRLTNLLKGKDVIRRFFEILGSSAQA